MADWSDLFQAKYPELWRVYNDLIAAGNQLTNLGYLKESRIVLETAYGMLANLDLS
jgi:hypothetical protein